MAKNLHHPTVVEEATKKAMPLAKHLGMASIPEDMLEMICPNLTYSGQFTPELYTKFQKVKRLLKELSEQTIPKAWAYCEVDDSV